MALLQILQYPDQRLHIKAAPVTQLTDEIRKIVEDMYETMYYAKGVGLAATQVGINWRIFTMDVSDTHDQPMCVINPEIISKEGVREQPEGCLSVQTAYDTLKRAAKIHLRAMDLNGEIFELHAEDLMAHCIQHEVDHLNGILFINHLSRLKQERIRKKIDKLKRQVQE